MVLRRAFLCVAGVHALLAPRAPKTSVATRATIAPAERTAVGGAALKQAFDSAKDDGRASLVGYLTGGYPAKEETVDLLLALEKGGADVIELGVPFTDPMADGATIQVCNEVALQQGVGLTQCLDYVKKARESGLETPVILMGYYNPFRAYGLEKLASDAAACGVDGFIIVDLPPEEAPELTAFSAPAGLDLIRLATPTTDDERLPKVLNKASGFIYYVSILGVTGSASTPEDATRKAVMRLKSHTDLPVAVGFGIKTPEMAATIAKSADAAVVGSAIVDRVLEGLDADGKPGPDTARNVLSFVSELAAGVRGA